MLTWLTKWWREFASGFWLMPAALLLAGILLSVVASELDREFDDYMPERLRTSAATGRATLGALAGAMITVTGVVFSTTTVALSITSTQLGPRLLRNFLEQQVTQVTLGVCLGTSAYCLILLRRVDRFEDEMLVPHGAILLASVLGVVTLMMIVYFIHRVTHSLQANNVASDVADDLDAAVQRLFPTAPGESGSDAAAAADAPAEGGWREAWIQFDEDDVQLVRAIEEGYVQAIDESALFAAARGADVALRVRSRPGDFLRKDDPLVDARPAGRLEGAALQRVQKAFLVGNLRTPQQDVECAVNELVEIAVRALSPGVNDPFTAIVCVDRLSGALCRLALRRPPSGLRTDDSGRLRLVARPRCFADALNAAMDPLRQHARGNLAVTARVMHALRAIATRCRRRSDRLLVKRQADRILSAADKSGLAEEDVREIEAIHADVVRALAVDQPWLDGHPPRTNATSTRNSIRSTPDV
ncbi:DUF2254 domain-containing protein [Botrimarina sp.]|uniref:DUF2254 domain-containing protein n=1 Tax=Botrimarina sp. TaxID=2795802 RepID=UPI0032EDA6A0